MFEGYKLGCYLEEGDETMDKYKLVGSLVMVSALAYLAYALISVTSELQNIREGLAGATPASGDN